MYMFNELYTYASTLPAPIPGPGGENSGRVFGGDCVDLPDLGLGGLWCNNKNKKQIFLLGAAVAFLVREAVPSMRRTAPCSPAAAAVALTVRAAALPGPADDRRLHSGGGAMCGRPTAYCFPYGHM